MTTHATLLRLATVLTLAVMAILFVTSAESEAAQRRRKSSASKKVVPSWPSFEARREEFIRRVRSANATGTIAPDPLSQFLVSEIVVTGIFEIEGGHGVFLHAIPSGRTFDARPGATLYNGHLADIVVGTDGFNDEGAVVFVERMPQSVTERQVTKRLEKAPERTDLAPATPPAPPRSAV